MPTNHINTLHELQKSARKILKTYPFDRLFLLFGDLGTGKTELTKNFVQILKAEDKATSPTFSIVNEYYLPKIGTIYHFDFYRLNSVDEIAAIGFEEYINSGNYCFIEWPELIEQLLRVNYISIKLSFMKNTNRTITYKKCFV